MSTDLVPGVNLQGFVQSRDEVLATVRRGLETLLEAEHLANKSGLGAVWGDLFTTIQHSTLMTPAINEAIIDMWLAKLEPRLDTSGWNSLLRASGLRTYMDNEARKEWDDAIARHDTPALEPDAIEATFRAIHSDRGQMVERGVLAVFRRLTRNRQTDETAMFGKKIIVADFLNRYGALSVDCGGVKELLRAMTVLDGKPEADDHGAINTANVRGEWQWSNDYVDLKWFKNGNAHATFKRPDLVDKLNAILAKHNPGALPAPR